MKHGSSTAVVAGITAALVAGLVTVGGISAAQVSNWGGQAGQGTMMGPPPMGRGTGGGTGMGMPGGSGPGGMGKGGQNMSAGMMGGPMAGGAQKIATMKAAVEKMSEKIANAEDKIKEWTDQMGNTDDELLLFFLDKAIYELDVTTSDLEEKKVEMETMVTALQKSTSSVSSK